MYSGILASLHKAGGLISACSVVLLGCGLALAYVHMCTVHWELFVRRSGSGLVGCLAFRFRVGVGVAKANTAGWFHVNARYGGWCLVEQGNIACAVSVFSCV